MDCGIPFCHWGCPVDNLIPEWNDLLYRGDWKRGQRTAAFHQQFSGIHRQNLPAPCEHSCVLNIDEVPVTIRENEAAIVERAFAEGYIKAQSLPNTNRKKSGRDRQWPCRHGSGRPAEQGRPYGHPDLKRMKKSADCSAMEFRILS
jgi:hypothetical protein